MIPPFPSPATPRREEAFSSLVRRVFLLCMVCLILSPWPAPAQKKGKRSPQAMLKFQLDTILDDTLFAPSFIGIKIVRAENGKLLYGRNSGKLFHPASNMKVLTTAAALATLPADFQLKTTVYGDERIEDGVVSGDLYVKGFGDAFFRTADMDSLARLVHRAGVRMVTGNLVGDVSYFDTLYWGKGWMWDDEPEADEAFITPLVVNSNAVRVVVRPGDSTGGPPDITVDPPLPLLPLTNRAVTSDDLLLPKLKATRPWRKNEFSVEGKISPYEDSTEFRLSVWQPELYFLELFKQKLTEHGITVYGSCLIDSIRRPILQLAELAHPLDSLVLFVNKKSDNIGAESLLKIMGAEVKGTPGTAANGLIVMEDYLFSIGVDTSKMILADGSGVSFYTTISPDAMVQVLLAQYRDSTLFNRFYASLPIAGVDGTLKSRMKETKAAGNVRAKTGSITGVSALSGYVTTADGKLLAFSILYNHFPGEAKVMRQAQNQIMEVLAKAKVGL